MRDRTLCIKLFVLFCLSFLWVYFNILNSGKKLYNNSHLILFAGLFLVYGILRIKWPVSGAVYLFSLNSRTSFLPLYWLKQGQWTSKMWIQVLKNCFFISLVFTIISILPSVIHLLLNASSYHFLLSLVSVITKLWSII